MAGGTSHGSGRVYRYYRCPANANKRSLTRECDLPGFRVDQVDEAAWQWVKSFLTNPQALEQGLWEVQRGREKENTLIQDRLAVVDDLLADNRSQLERLLELYLSGEFQKDVLTERKARLEETNSTLENERVGLVASLETRVLSVEQIHTTQELAAKVCRNLHAADDDFDAKRQIIEELDVQATLVVESGERVVYARCILGEQVFGVRPIHQGMSFGKYGSSLIRRLWPCTTAKPEIRGSKHKAPD
jgi:hypothetical protein